MSASQTGGTMRLQKSLATGLFILITIPSWACGPCEVEQCAFGACICTPRLRCIAPIVPDIPTPGDISRNIKKNVEKVGEDVLSTMEKAGGDTIRTLEKAGGDTFNTLNKAGDDSVRTFVKAKNDTAATYVKAWDDTNKQAKRSFDDAVDAGSAVANFTLNQLRSQKDVFENAANRMREGKVVDAMWGLGVEPLQASEANFAKATQESTLIATAAATAAATYGGPAGAAAYAAWSTYKATGDADMALRVGLLAAATSYSGAAVSNMPSGTAGEIFKKTALAGAAGGIAVAAAGGDEQAIKDGFLKSGGAVLIQAGNDKAKSFSPKLKDAWDTVHCISAQDVDCVSKTTWARDAKGKILYDNNGKPRINPVAIDPSQRLGRWTKLDPNSPAGKAANIITKISKLPKSETIPVMNNKWVLTWTLGKDPTLEYGRPVVVLTYVGPKPPFTSTVTYGRADEVPSWLKNFETGTPDSGITSYACTLAGIDRTVKISKAGKGCEALYSREDGVRQVVYHSDHFQDVCTVKAAEFVRVLKRKGIRCKAR